MKRWRGAWLPWALALAPLVLLAGVVVVPAASLLWSPVALPPGLEQASQPVWQDPYLRWRLQWTVLQALLTCALCTVLGVPIAWVLARFEFALRAPVLRLLLLPFVVPTLVAALGVLAIWGPQGWLVRWGGPDLLDTPLLLLYGNLFFNLTLVVRAVSDALGQVNAHQVAVARTLGATPWRCFWRVEWPSVLPALGATLCLVFLYCCTGFGLALVLGGQRWATVEVEIYALVAHELALAQARELALWSLAVCAVGAGLYALLEQRWAVPQRPQRLPRHRPRGAWQWLAVAAALLALGVLCAAPLLAIVAAALGASTGAWQMLAQADTALALTNSAQFVGVALAAALVLGLLHAYAARQHLLLRALGFLPFVVSPVIVALGLLVAYPGWVDQVVLLWAAYAVLAYPLVAQATGTGLQRLAPHYRAAARSLGATPWRAFVRVEWPLLQTSVRRGLAFAAASAVGEFAVALMLTRPEWLTLTTLTYQHLGQPGQVHRETAMLLACLLLLLAAAAFVLVESGRAEDGDA